MRKMNALRSQIGFIHMVNSDGCRSGKSDISSIQEIAIERRARACDNSVKTPMP